jgi:hypothetical protein
MKELLSKKRKLNDEEVVALTENRSSILQRKLLQKMKVPSSFTIHCSIGKLSISKALFDLGASINLTLVSMLNMIKDAHVKPSNMTPTLEDRSIKYPYVVVEDVSVKFEKLIF